MKLTDLKSPYRELAEMRHEQKPHPYLSEGFAVNNELTQAFLFVDTPEGLDFWNKVRYENYPPIPQSSLDELEAWQELKYKETSPIGVHFKHCYQGEYKDKSLDQLEQELKVLNSKLENDESFKTTGITPRYLGVRIRNLEKLITKSKLTV